MTTPYMLGDIRRDENCKLTAYPDVRSPLGQRLLENKERREKGEPELPVVGLSGDPWTIGYGHTGPEVHEGLVWTQEQANNALASDVAATSRQLDAEMPWWRDLTDLRQDALLNMAFNLGVAGLAKFKSFLGLMQRSLWALAAHDLGGTLWASQVGERATRLAYQIRTGLRQT